MAARTLHLYGASEVVFDDAWLPREDADRALEAILAEAPWKQDAITLFGRRILQPRLSVWMGDEGAVYTYSGLTLAPEAWTPAVHTMLRRAEEATGAPFNSVLLNLYRHGQDSMGMHADDEPELGPSPDIASVSLGVTRTFVLKAKKKREDAAPVRLPLTHGSLLVMRGGTQRHWVHGVPKQARVDGPRINLTFRLVLEKTLPRKGSVRCS